MIESDCLVPQHDLYLYNTIYIYIHACNVCITAQSLSCPNSVSEKSPEYEVQLHPQFHEQRMLRCFELVCLVVLMPPRMVPRRVLCFLVFWQHLA